MMTSYRRKGMHVGKRGAHNVPKTNGHKKPISHIDLSIIRRPDIEYQKNEADSVN